MKRMSFLLLFFFACSGSIADGSRPDDEQPCSAVDGCTDIPGDSDGDGGSGGGSPGTLEAAPARIRRLTVRELESSLADVFLGARRLAMGHADTVAAHGFDTNFEALPVSQVFSEALQSYAEAVSVDVAGRLPTLLPCFGKGDARACASTFIATFGPKLYRRALTSPETESLLVAYDETTKVADTTAGIRAIIESMVQSPLFLFRTEYGSGTGARVRLTDDELASALSYALWGTTPDDALRARVARGELSTASGLRATVDDLLGDPRSREGLRRFLQQWMEVTPSVLRPEPPSLLTSIVGENERFIDAALAGDDTLAALFSRDDSFSDAELGKVQGTRDATTRAGFLTQAAFLGSHLGPTFAPVQLGRFVRTKLFCGTLPDPPPDVPPLPPASPTSTVRERFAVHEESPACSGCHLLMDPIGFGFERYDAMGRMVAVDGGQTLTGEGRLIETDVDGAFTGPRALAAMLGRSAQVRTCFAEQMLEYVLGRAYRRDENATDLDSTHRALATAKDDASPSVRAMVRAFVTSDAFLLRDARPRL